MLFSQSTSCSSWSEQSEEKSLYGAEIYKPDPQSFPVLYGAGLYKCPSVLSVDSVASTFLPSPSPDSMRSSSTTRIGTRLTALMDSHPCTRLLGDQGDSYIKIDLVFVLNISQTSYKHLNLYIFSLLYTCSYTVQTDTSTIKNNTLKFTFCKTLPYECKTDLFAQCIMGEIRHFIEEKK